MLEHNDATSILGAIEKLAKEDPRRARTGQVLDNRIADRRSELKKGSKKTKEPLEVRATPPLKCCPYSRGSTIFPCSHQKCRMPYFRGHAYHSLDAWLLSAGLLVCGAW